ncbi:hypothetical protein A4V09_15150 [Blautia pseudococcoides]|uniref:Uncharacterized protein n=2 Tax=Blautia pseudococcoides TaxID=1796616 RepID=A0A1C7ID87_9FIRM|nr:hypothetical protein A4V09_15150 [Blautia pseudococcoides]
MKNMWKRTCGRKELHMNDLIKKAQERETSLKPFYLLGKNRPAQGRKVFPYLDDQNPDQQMQGYTEQKSLLFVKSYPEGDQLLTEDDGYIVPIK